MIRAAIHTVTESDYRWFAARLMIEVYDLNQISRREAREAREAEAKMSVEVKGLANTIRDAKAAIGKASNAAQRMQASASRLTGTLAQVEDMTNQLDAANADLQGAVGTLSNGGPPLDDTASIAYDVTVLNGPKAPPSDALHSAAVQVSASNNGAQ